MLHIDRFGSIAFVVTGNHYIIKWAVLQTSLVSCVGSHDTKQKQVMYGCLRHFVLSIATKLIQVFKLHYAMTENLCNDELYVATNQTSQLSSLIHF